MTTEKTLPEASAAVAGATAPATRTPAPTRAPSYPTMDPNIIPTFCASLRDYVTAQVGARLDSAATIYGPDQRHAVLDAAMEDFPFLAEVDWDSERIRRMRVSAAARRASKKKAAVGRSTGTNAAMSTSAGASTGMKKKAAGAGTATSSTKKTKSKGRVGAKTSKATNATGVRATSLGSKKRGRLTDSTTSSEKTPKRARVAVMNDAEEEAGKESSNTESAKVTAAAGRAARAARRSAEGTPTNVGGESVEVLVSTRRVSSAKKPKAPVVQSDDSDESYRLVYQSDSDESYHPEKKTKRAHVRQKSPSFEERMEQCHEFKQKEGHLNIPLDHKRDGLGEWAQDMRLKYKSFFDGRYDNAVRSRKTTISNRLEELEEIGFVFEWGVDAASPVDVEQEKGAASRTIWDFRLNQCRQFKTDNGHLNIPSSHKSLGKWSDRMRGLYKQRLEGKPELSGAQNEKIRALESLGFAFDRTFDVNLGKLAAFKAREGHCKVPLKYDADRALGSWVEQVRREYNRMNRGEKSSYLTMDRLRKLNNVGFVFQGKARQDTPWEVNFERLRTYREEHGRDPSTTHEVLGSWIGKQRSYYNRKLDGKGKHHLSEEREKKLRDIGFVFQAGPRLNAEALVAHKEGLKKTWDDRLEEFVRWKEKHGHPYVPTVTNNEDKQLGRWVAKQRQAYKALQEGKNNKRYGILSAEKALKLANAGFAFDASHIHKTPKDVEAVGMTGGDGSDADQEEEGSHDEEAMMAEWYKQERPSGEGDFSVI